jgi:hypothetical protein
MRTENSKPRTRKLATQASQRERVKRIEAPGSCKRRHGSNTCAETVQPWCNLHSGPDASLEFPCEHSQELRRWCSVSRQRKDAPSPSSSSKPCESIASTPALHFSSPAPAHSHALQIPTLDLFSALSNKPSICFLRLLLIEQYIINYKKKTATAMPRS